MVHQNRFAEFDRLHHLSGGITREGDVEALLGRMLDFAEAGFADAHRRIMASMDKAWEQAAGVHSILGADQSLRMGDLKVAELDRVAQALDKLVSHH